MSKEKMIRIVLNVLIAVMTLVAAALIFYGLSLAIVSIIYDVFKHFDQAGAFSMTGAIVIYILLLGAIGLCVFFHRKEAAEEKAYLRRRINDELFLIRHKVPSNAELYQERERLQEAVKTMDQWCEDDTIQFCERYERMYCRICAIEEELERRGA